MEPTLRPLPEVVVNPDLAQARIYLSQGRAGEAKASLKSYLAVAPDDREGIDLLLSVDALEQRKRSADQGQSLQDKLGGYFFWSFVLDLVCDFVGLVLRLFRG